LTILQERRDLPPDWFCSSSSLSFRGREPLGRKDSSYLICSNRSGC